MVCLFIHSSRGNDQICQLPKSQLKVLHNAFIVSPTAAHFLDVWKRTMLLNFVNLFNCVDNPPLPVPSPVSISMPRPIFLEPPNPAPPERSHLRESPPVEEGCDDPERGKSGDAIFGRRRMDDSL